MSKDQVKRLGELAVRLVSNHAVPGVKDLFQALIDERSRRFVADLNTACDENRSRAEERIRALASTDSGAKVLMHIARECFFGTERISLAAMAVLVSEYDDCDPGYREVAGRALEGLADIDALVFLIVFSRPKSCRPIPSKWRPGYAFDAKVVLDEEWKSARTLVGASEEVLFAAITECLRRRILLPDSASGRFGGDGDVALRHFCTTHATLSFYRTLHRASQIVDPSLTRELNLFAPDFMRASWWPPGTDEALARARTG
jgi:hypothetical protein